MSAWQFAGITDVDRQLQRQEVSSRQLLQGEYAQTWSCW